MEAPKVRHPPDPSVHVGRDAAWIAKCPYCNPKPEPKTLAATVREETNKATAVHSTVRGRIDASRTVYYSHANGKKVWSYAKDGRAALKCEFCGQSAINLSGPELQMMVQLHLQMCVSMLVVR